MNEQHLVSIVMPTYNSMEYISETLDSVKNQSYKNWEIIIVDDGSTDRTINVIKSSNEPRIKIFKRDRLPKGASTCRNIGIENANGEYIMFLDSDDLLDPNSISKRMGLMQENPKLDFIVFSTAFFYNTIGDCNRKPHYHSNKSKHLQTFILLEAPWYINSPLWKKKFIIMIGGFNEKYERYQDTELHIRALLQKGVKYDVVDIIDTHYRLPIENRSSIKRTKAFYIIILNSLHKFQKEFLAPNYLSVLNNSSKKRISLKFLHKLIYRIYIYLRKEDTIKKKYMSEAVIIDSKLYKRNLYEKTIIRIHLIVLNSQWIPIIIKKIIFRIIIRL